MRTPLVAFITLQILDLITTLGAFALGGTETNPLVGHFLVLGPIRGLLLSKTLVIAIAASGAALGKARGIRIANLAFCGIVVWNLTIVARLALRA